MAVDSATVQKPRAGSPAPMARLPTTVPPNHTNAGTTPMRKPIESIIGEL